MERDISTRGVLTDRNASDSAEEKKRVIIKAEERHASRIPLVKMKFKA